MSTWNIFQIFLKEHDVLISWSLDQLHKLLYDLVILATKGLSSSMFTGGFLCLFTAKQLKIDKGIPCPGSIIPSELHPAYDSLINTSIALLGQHQSSKTHLLCTAHQSSSWCGGREVSFSSGHSSWNAAGSVVRKCNVWLVTSL